MKNDEHSAVRERIKKDLKALRESLTKGQGEELVLWVSPRPRLISYPSDPLGHPGTCVGIRPPRPFMLRS
jgi:hypothetical protein